MYELVQAGERSYYINSPAKIGVYLLNDTDAYLIDSGNDKDAGKKVLKLLKQQNWNLRAIFNTHSNADHIGGNKYLQQQTGCKIYAPGIEAAFTRFPILEPSFLYGGYPCKDLRHKFLLAAESDAQDLSADCLPDGMKAIPLPGHFFNMAGFGTPDGTIFLADCVSSESTLEKYQVSFIYDVAAYLQTLDQIEKLQAKLFVPAHAPATDDIKPLADINRKKIYEVAEKILCFCAAPVCFEQILQKVFAEYQLIMDFEQYVLVGSTVRSYLSWLKDTDKLETSFENHMLLWKRRV